MINSYYYELVFYDLLESFGKAAKLMAKQAVPGMLLGEGKEQEPTYLPS